MYPYPRVSPGVYLQRWVRARVDEPIPLVVTVGISLLWLASRRGVDVSSIPATGETLRPVRVKSLVASGIPARLRLSPRQVLEKADTLVRTARLEPRRLWFVDGWRERIVQVVRLNDYLEAKEVAYAIALETGFDEHAWFLSRYRVPHARREHGVEHVGEGVAIGKSMVRKPAGLRSLQRLS